MINFDKQIKDTKKTIAEFYERLQDVEDTHIRLGDVSAWAEYGKKNGYWEYFEKSIKEEFLKKIESEIFEKVLRILDEIYVIEKEVKEELVKKEVEKLKPKS